MTEPDPLWLDPDERAAWLAVVGLMIQLPSALDSQLQRDSGLSFFEYMVVAMLAEQPDRSLRMSRLAAITNSSLSRLSHVARRLEGQGFIRREADVADGRFTNAILTDAGLAKVQAAAPGHVAAARSLVIDALTSSQLRELRTAGELILQRIHPGLSFPVDL